MLTINKGNRMEESEKTEIIEKLKVIMPDLVWRRKNGDFLTAKYKEFTVDVSCDGMYQGTVNITDKNGNEFTFIDANIIWIAYNVFNKHPEKTENIAINSFLNS